MSDRRPYTPRAVVLSLYTLPLEGRNFMSLCCMAILYKTYNARMGGQSYVTRKAALEVVTVLKRSLYVQGSWQNGIMGGMSVTF